MHHRFHVQWAALFFAVWTVLSIIVSSAIKLAAQWEKAVVF